GTITIKNLFGHASAILPVDAFFALPESTRYREIIWENSGFAIGRYTAELSLFKGYDNQYEQSKIAYWVIPWKVVIIALIVIALIVVFLYYILVRFELKRRK